MITAGSGSYTCQHVLHELLPKRASVPGSTPTLIPKPDSRRSRLLLPEGHTSKEGPRLFPTIPSEERTRPRQMIQNCDLVYRRRDARQQRTWTKYNAPIPAVAPQLAAALTSVTVGILAFPRIFLKFACIPFLLGLVRSLRRLREPSSFSSGLVPLHQRHHPAPVALSNHPLPTCLQPKTNLGCEGKTEGNETMSVRTGTRTCNASCSVVSGDTLFHERLFIRRNGRSNGRKARLGTQYAEIRSQEEESCIGAHGCTTIPDFFAKTPSA